MPLHTNYTPPGMQWTNLAPGVNQLAPDPNYAMPAPDYVREDPVSLASRTNQFMTGQAQAPYLANLPQYADLTEARSGVLSDQMAGRVPQDVINQILQQGAERGIVTGSPGGPGANAAFLRSLGLTSLDMQQRGMQGFSQAIADTPVPELFNPASLYVPERAAFQEFQTAQGRNPFASAASPGPTAPERRTMFDPYAFMAQQDDMRRLLGRG
jgi:hypothetical protein